MTTKEEKLPKQIQERIQRLEWDVKHYRDEKTRLEAENSKLHGKIESLNTTIFQFNRFLTVIETVLGVDKGKFPGFFTFMR